jgi:hypothetical protein
MYHVLLAVLFFNLEKCHRIGNQREILYHYLENWRRGAKFPFALGPKNSLGGPANRLVSSMCISPRCWGWDGGYYRVVSSIQRYVSPIIYLCKNKSVGRTAKRIFGPQGKRKLGPPPPILQIMILKLSPPRCVISKESVQQK